MMRAVQLRADGADHGPIGALPQTPEYFTKDEGGRHVG